MDCESWERDGICFDVPDRDENARVFGRPSSRPGKQAAFPNIITSQRHLPRSILLIVS